MTAVCPGPRGGQKKGSDPDPLLMGWVRAKFGIGLASAGIAAFRKKVMNGRLVPPRKGGARLHRTSGMSHEATQEMGGWRLWEVMAKVYPKARPGEVATKMWAALKSASDGPKDDQFAQELGESVTLMNENGVGLAVFVHRGLSCGWPIFWKLRSLLSRALAFLALWGVGCES